MGKRYRKEERRAVLEAAVGGWSEGALAAEITVQNAKRSMGGQWYNFIKKKQPPEPETSTPASSACPAPASPGSG